MQDTRDPPVSSEHPPEQLKKHREGEDSARSGWKEEQRLRQGGSSAPGAAMARWLLLAVLLALLIPAAPGPLRALSRWELFGAQSPQGFPPHVRRHSEGTFTSDFTRYLDRMKAKDFVHWLINTKRYN